MISREQTSNLVKLAILVMINLCIIYFAFSQSPSSTVVSAEKSTIDVVSQYGSQSDEVTQIQTRLKSWGYFSGPVTGYYGSQTTEAIKKFQQTHGLSATGVADEKTLELIGLPSSSSSSASVSNSDFELLARIISAEARGEPYIGQVAVGAVVLNRVESSSFPDSISGVVYQPGAFTAITDGQINEAVTESAHRAAQEALNGSDPTGGALYYYNPDKTSNNKQVDSFPSGYYPNRRSPLLFLNKKPKANALGFLFYFFLFLFIYSIPNSFSACSLFRSRT